MRGLCTMLEKPNITNLVNYLGFWRVNAEPSGSIINCEISVLGVNNIAFLSVELIDEIFGFSSLFFASKNID